MVTAGVDVFLVTGFLVFAAVAEDLEVVELFLGELEGLEDEGAGLAEDGFSGPAFSLASACAFSFGSAFMESTCTGRA